MLLIRCFTYCLSICFLSLQCYSQVAKTTRLFAPLDTIIVENPKGLLLKVSDSKGKIYHQSSSKPIINFLAAGALGKHEIWYETPKKQKIIIGDFWVNASTNFKYCGIFDTLFNIAYHGLNDKESGFGEVTWNGKKYRYFVPWILDHGHNMRSQKYFYDFGHEFLDLLKASQRSDGMIYSFVEHMPRMEYWFTRDKFSGYTQRIGDKVFVRQPTENHPEYMYVDAIYQAWKSSGDDQWMKSMLTSAAKALDYAPNDPARWSKRFQLLKRVYTIDSWDFAVEDEYLPDLGLTNTMIIDPEKSKFGVFFGDNTGYIAACFELAEMMQYAGFAQEAERFQKRGQTLKERLDKLAWNGRFYRHFIDEDSTVVRKLGVDESQQVAQSNAYSLNRPITPTQAKAIIETYLHIRQNLPSGSPGEFYAIYPPFERGFGQHGDKWQYMNGGVGGHVAGELARGTYEFGYEKYASDILKRVYELAKKYDNKIYFSYTGAIFPPPPPPHYKPLDLSLLANMDSWVSENPTTETFMRGKRVGDDFSHLPLGKQIFANIPFVVIDPNTNARKAVLAVSKQKGLPEKIEIPVGQTASSIYLLHTSSKPLSENIAACLKLKYTDGSYFTQYLIHGKHLTYWWFSTLETDRSGVAWYGKNAVSEGIGLSWCAIDNPHPQKPIASVSIEAEEGGVIYTLFGLT
ncbi:MAG: hypothetical protein ACK4GN_00005, partial [Runella sp.]